MHKRYRKIRKQAGLFKAIGVGLLIALPAMPVASVALPLNPRPSIFNEAPYNRSPGGEPTTEPVLQPPPEEQQPPSAIVMPVNGKINIKLMNATNTVVNYQVIGDTNQRTLAGGTDVTLQNIATPVTVTCVREDNGLLKVIPTASQGLLEVMLDETTSLDEDQHTIRVEQSGGVLIN